MESDKRKDEDLQVEGELLPNREAMSILPIEPTGMSFGEVAPPPETDAAASMSGVPGTDAAASGSGSETVSEEDRSETISQSDSASSET